MGGWAFFVAENAVLSENRATIISWLDGNENTYHALYGFGSTLATGSIMYSYYHLTRKVPFAAAAAQPISVGRIGLAWTCLSLGCAMAFQALPKMQLPVDPAKNFSVRCPFDFSDRKVNDSGMDAKVQGLERITRHPVRLEEDSLDKSQHTALPANTIASNLSLMSLYRGDTYLPTNAE